MTEVLEVTTFKLAGYSGDEFVVANDDINVYLQRQPGYRWRRITQDQNGLIIDIVAWDSMAEAESGANGIMTEMGRSMVHSMIDRKTVDWRLTTVLRQM